jgi:hypothetical protein
MGRTLLRRRSLVVLSIAIVVSLASWPVVALADDGVDLASAADDTVEVADQAAEGATEEVTEASGGATEEVTEAATESTQDATQAAGEATEEVTEAATESTQDATQAAGEATEEVTEAATESTQQVAGTAGSLSEDVTDSSNAEIDDVSGTAVDIVTETSSSTDAAVQGEEPFGTQLVDASGEAAGASEPIFTSVTDVSTMASVTEELDEAASTVTSTASHPISADVVAVPEELAALSSDVVDAASGTSVDIVTHTSGSAATAVQTWAPVVTDVSSMATTTVAPALEGVATTAAQTASRPVAAELVAVPVTGSSWFAGCPHACDRYEDTFASQGVLGGHGILGDDESFTDSVISAIRSLAMTGLHLLLQMWSVIVLAILGAALIEATRRRRQVHLLEPSRG